MRNTLVLLLFLCISCSSPKRPDHVAKGPEDPESELQREKQKIVMSYDINTSRTFCEDFDILIHYKDLYDRIPRTAQTQFKNQLALDIQTLQSTTVKKGLEIIRSDVKELTCTSNKNIDHVFKPIMDIALWEFLRDNGGTSLTDRDTQIINEHLPKRP